MAFNYPAKPWKDGQEIKATVGGKELVIAKYDSSKNLWTHLHYNDEGEFFYTTACKVLIDFDECPCDDLNADSLWENTENVQNALDWLHLQVVRLIERVDDLSDRVKKNENDIVYLYQTLSAIENLEDAAEVIKKLEEVLERLDNLNATDIAQSPLPGQAGFEIPDGVKPGTQQETNYYLADLIATLSAANNQDHETFREELANLEGLVIDNNNDTNDALDTKVDKAGDTMTGALDFQLGVKTSPQFSISPNIAGTATNVFTTQGGQLRLRTSHTEDINDRVGSHIILDPNSGDPVTSIFNVRDPANERDAAPRIYVDEQDEDLQGQIDDGIETQQEIIADIETLQNKVTALEGSVVDATWTFESDDRTPRPGEFALRGGGDAVISDWSAAQSIIISTTSADGETFTFEKVTVNDVIRIGAADGSNAEYKILTIVSPGVYLVEHLRSSGVATDELDYSFSFLSSFDPEGLATIDYVDAQDNTRVKKTGDTVQGALVFDTHNSIFEVAGDTGSMRRRYVKVRGNNQFEILAYPAQDNNASKVAFRLVSNTNGSPELTLNYLVDPTSNGHAVNKRWGDANYYPFTGGAITGNVTIENASFYVKDENGDETFRVQPNGFCRTSDLFRAQRDDGGPALQARIGSTLNAEIRCDGISSFKGQMNLNSNKITNVATPTSNNDAANKKYVDDNVGTAAPIKTGTSSNPSLAKGELYFNTSSKQLFVGT